MENFSDNYAEMAEVKWGVKSFPDPRTQKRVRGGGSQGSRSTPEKESKMSRQRGPPWRKYYDKTLVRAVPEYCWLFRLVSGTAPNQSPSVFPIPLPTVLGDALRLSPSTVGSPDWFQEWLQIKANRFSQSLSQPYSETPWLVAFQTQTQNRSVLATQSPKSQPCPRW